MHITYSRVKRTQPNVRVNIGERGIVARGLYSYSCQRVILLYLNKMSFWSNPRVSHVPFCCPCFSQFCLYSKSWSFGFTISPHSSAVIEPALHWNVPIKKEATTLSLLQRSDLQRHGAEQRSPCTHPEELLRVNKVLLVFTVCVVSSRSVKDGQSYCNKMIWSYAWLLWRHFKVELPQRDRSLGAFKFIV